MLTVGARRALRWAAGKMAACDHLKFAKVRRSNSFARHGRRSPRIREVRFAEHRAAQEEERKKFEAWSATISQTDYAKILEEIRRERAILALTDPELWG